MAEEFQMGIRGEAWWVNPTRSCDHMGSFIWSSSDMVDTKTTAAAAAITTTTKSCEDTDNNSVSAENRHMLFQKQTDSDSGDDSSSILMGSTLHTMKFCPSSSSSSTDWNQALHCSNGRSENNYRNLMLDDLNSQIQKEWRSPKSFINAGDHQDFSLDNYFTGLSAGFPANSASYGHGSTLLQSYVELHPSASLQKSLDENNPTGNYGTNSNELSSSWPNFVATFLNNSMPKQQQSGMHFSNNTSFWNASDAIGLNDNTPGLLATALEEKHTCLTFNTKHNNVEVLDSGSVAKKGSSESAFKRPRMETPLPLPTFKVRKEKLGDRITALQQLVSPFGKTDTASVLNEANEYIKFLHDQVGVLTTPYLKQQGSQIPQQQTCDHKLKEPAEVHKQDLKSRGLCLVPISSTFPVANETTTDFWTPTFGGTFR